MGETITGSQIKLHDLLCEERRLLTQFLQVTQEQAQIIAEEDEGALYQNLEQRQAIISRVDDLLTELIPLWQDYTAALDQAPGLNDLHKDIGRILREATEMDKKNQSAVRERMESLREQLRRTSETRRGAETYIKGAETFSAGFVDEKQ